MTITTLNNQDECLAFLRDAGLDPASIQPTPPHPVCDGLASLSDGTWLIVTNARGQFTITMIEDATKAQAWEIFDRVRGEHGPGKNPRAVMIGGENYNSAAN